MATSSRPRFQTYWKAKFGGEFETPFSERLLNLLYFHTDVGIIPRGKLEVTPASNYYDYYNWKKPIQGCYWCSAADTSHQAICCSSDCLYLFHQWCVHKVNKTSNSTLCILPGCEEELAHDSTLIACCGEHFMIYSAEYGMILSPNGTNPHWYCNLLEQPIQSIMNSTDRKDENIGFGTETSTDGMSFVEDFETVAANVREKIGTYFSQLLETIRNRQTNLISELDEILSRYKQERARQRDKVRELEEMEKYNEDITNPPFEMIVSHTELLAKLRGERDIIENMKIEFEWDRRYAREASKIGNLKQVSASVSLESSVPFETETAREEDGSDLSFKPKRIRISNYDEASTSPLSYNKSPKPPRNYK